MAKLCQDGQQEKCDPRLRPRRAQLIDIVGIQSHLCSYSAVSIVNLHESGDHEGTAKRLYIASCTLVVLEVNLILNISSAIAGMSSLACWDHRLADLVLLVPSIRLEQYR